MAGRPRKPTALRLVHGTRGKNQNKSEPMPTGEANAPDWLSDEAKDVWKHLATELEAIGLLTSMDEQAFAVYCQSYAELIEAEAELVKGGKTQTTKDGFVRKSPWLSVRDEAHKRMQQIGAQFGFSPASRTRIEVKPKDDKSPKAQYLG
jgi:P27 family predicted phage terminase small subunit